MKKRFKLAISSPPRSRLGIADFNALDDLKKGLERRDLLIEVVTHSEAENLPEVAAWAARNEIPIRVLQPEEPGPGVTDLVAWKLERPSPARFVAVISDGCARVGDGGEIAAECKAAGVPVWTFTPNARPTDPGRGQR